jgi:putative DNA primase/helicase
MKTTGEFNGDHLHPETADARVNGNGYATNGHASLALDGPVKKERKRRRPGHDGYAPLFSEEGMALSFADKYSEFLRYVNVWRIWMKWTGTRWAKEDTLWAYDLIRKECRLAAASAYGDVNIAGEKKGGIISALTKAKMRAAIETLARSDRQIAATTDQWNGDDWLINTPGGIVDLRTGENIGNDPSKFCTKITAVAPGGDCPLWESFLHKVTAGDEELQAYLKRMCGHFLTGSIREHALFFIYGPGGNGKGVFLNTISAVMGDYHVVSPAQTFAEQKGQRHETELARLDGARLVISQETEQGQYWAESRIKSLTGGDRIAARFMRGDFFEFDPKFKLCIVGNHKPQLRAVDDAIRRRFNLIPFDVKISPEEKDPNLFEKLKAEYGGILQWMIDGCLEWQREGLSPPETVLAATTDYLDSEDTIGLWLSDMCVTPGSYSMDPERHKAADVRSVRTTETTLASLFKSWKDYAEANHFPPKNNKVLADQLKSRGFTKGKDRRGAFIRGLRLKTYAEQVADGVIERPANGDSECADESRR